MSPPFGKNKRNRKTKKWEIYVKFSYESTRVATTRIPNKRNPRQEEDQISGKKWKKIQRKKIMHIAMVST